MICYAYYKEERESITMSSTEGNDIDVSFLFASLYTAQTFFHDTKYKFMGACEFDMDKEADGWYISGMWFKVDGKFFHSLTGIAVWGDILKYDDNHPITSPFLIDGTETLFKDWLPLADLSGLVASS